MNIFWRELKYSRKSMIWWCVGILFMVVSGMSKYGTMKSSGQSANEIFGAMPKSLQAIFGLSSLDLSTVMGFYGMLFSYLVLMATIHAVMLGANMVAKEERDKTSEFLMAKPVSRIRIITSKLAASLVLLVIFNLVTYAFSTAMVKHYESTADTGEIWKFMAGLLLLQVLFLAIGMVIAAITKHPKRATSLAAGILLAAYILSIVIELNDKLDALKYITPFKYFEAKNLLSDSGVDAVLVTLAAVICAACLSAAFVFYKKRDLKS
ncbi:ABC transporter permease subunit [Fictibacillus terranigra]|uniref:ABC transporter permease subunit n=1 Tax=Fictibacillus terranigra TaxID=3058424 RepID=A0ABT8EB08_9BACL|nr:ABC transporter permease subunit [Fictibacillus sp. CENA-BCM004]MDN4075084.1 ABC transporter permease subunit [Fictibacillus sp. CENA-BCM004]